MDAVSTERIPELRLRRSFSNLACINIRGVMVADHGNTMRIRRRAEPQINEKPACRKLWFKWDHGHFLFWCPSIGFSGFLVELCRLGGIMLKEDCESIRQDAENLVCTCNISVINHITPTVTNHHSYWELGKSVDPDEHVCSRIRSCSKIHFMYRSSNDRLAYMLLMYLREVSK